MPHRMDRAISIMYHDVIDSDVASSGFTGAGADIYKLDRLEFAGHLDSIRRPPDVIGREQRSRTPLFLTFDDGGVSAHTHIAPMLEERGWRGHFFVTTDRIGQPGFLDASQIRDLSERGHVIGSHSCSHPPRISACSPAELRREWTDSVAALASIVNRDVTVASVPGGFYSAAVGRAAAAAGIQVLFTSEPTTRVGRIGECLLLGRYGIWRGMPPSTSGAIAAGALVPRLRQAAWWSVKKAAKSLPGDPYAKLRRTLLGRRA
jgi:peptidoglycan/xylan/chitin deacetylase (PgdA/CDA1 family)